MTDSPQARPQMWTRLPWRVQTRAEYDTAVRQPHGSVRRFLTGCRCESCDRAPNRSFRFRLLDANDRAWNTSA